MKKSFGKAFAITFGLLCFLPGCQGSKGTNVSIASESEWGMVFDLHEVCEINSEGFLNEDYGLSVGDASICCYTQDGGTTWTRAKNNSADRYCLDLVNESLAFCGGEGKEVRVTKDGGKTWQDAGKTECLALGHTGIDFIDENIGWVNTANQVAATSDGGKTYTELKIPEEIEWISAIHLRTKEDGYILATDGSLYRTKDGGKSFDKKKIELNVLDGSYDYDGTKGKLYYEVVPLSDLTFFDENNGTIAVICRRADKTRWVFVLTTGDGGDTWSADRVSVPADFVPKRLFLSEDGNYLSVGSRDRMVLLKRTTAGTTEPTEAPTAVPTAEPTKAPTAVPTKEPTKAPTPVPVKPLVEKESTYQLVRETNPASSVHIEGFLDENFGVAVGYSGATFYTEDGGATWTESENTSMCRFCLDIIRKDLIFSGGNGSDVRMSRDGGKIFEVLQDAKGLFSINTGISFTDEKVGWVCTNDKLVMTTDGTENWSTVTTPKEIKKIGAIELLSEKEGYVLATNGSLYFTKDGGTSWKETNVSLATYGAYNASTKKSEMKKASVATAAMAFLDERNGRIALICNQKDGTIKVYVITTTDGGENYVSEQIALPDGFTPSRIYLSENGQFLTIGGTGKALVFKSATSILD